MNLYSIYMAAALTLTLILSLMSWALISDLHPALDVQIFEESDDHE